MPWEVTEVVQERMRFIARLENGERMTDLCREYGIARKTGYKYWNRYKEGGPKELFDQSRRPGRSPSRTTEVVKALVVAQRHKYPKFGPKKLRVLLVEENPGVRIPAPSTIGLILKSAGLTEPRTRRRRASPTPCDKLTKAYAPNDVWCADFKGQFRMGNSKYCYPLTITDQHSRYILACEGLDGTAGDGARAVFANTFAKYGLPRVIRTDNGSPFASTGLLGMSRLSVWLMRLGIKPERIEPGHPEQNGRHERMHLTLKQETTRPSGKNMLQQQEKFDAFLTMFNKKRPHEALKMDRPANVYFRSPQHFPETLPTLDYPLHDDVRRVYDCGRILIADDHRAYLTTSLAGQLVGIRELSRSRWLVTFNQLDLGIVEKNSSRLKPVGTP